MKKLLIICFLLATAFTSQAQDKKPIKEETVKFIDQALKLRIGTASFKRYTIQEINFKPELITLVDLLDDKTRRRFNEYSNIKWETLINISIDLTEYTKMTLKFEANYKFKYEDYIDYSKILTLPIPENKIESLKKAFLRLSEIAKEENKDPFED